jgi:hypothetical protein
MTVFCRDPGVAIHLAMTDLKPEDVSIMRRQNMKKGNMDRGTWLYQKDKYNRSNPFDDAHLIP